MTAMFDNLLAYSVQVLIVGGVGAALAVVLRLQPASMRLVYLQTLLVLCITLPLLQPWEPQASEGVVTVRATAPIVVGEPARQTPQPIRWDSLAPVALVAGATLRIAWLALGLLRLRRYRGTAMRITELPLLVRGIRERVGAEPDLYVSSHVSSPIMFGFSEPAVLLPERFFELPHDVQEAALCHELLHVRRRDWVFTLAEEFVYALLWFHPVVWWIVAQIRLAREQAVDAAVVRITGRREQYVDALLAIAGSKARLDLAPASLFLRRRHLARRIASLLKEASMSKRQFAISAIAAMAALVIAAGVASRAFPLKAAPQEVKDAPGVEVQAGERKLLHRGGVEYPEAARLKKVEGTVDLELVLDAEGNVTDAQVLSGPDELRRAALQSALTWHYEPGSGPARVRTRVDFKLPPEGQPGRVVSVQARPVPAPGAVLSRVGYRTVPEPLQVQLAQRLERFKGLPYNNDVMSQIQEAVKGLDEHLHLLWGPDFVEVVLPPPGARIQSFSGSRVPPPPSTAGADGGPGSPTRIRVGGNLQADKLIYKKPVEYPPLARQARIQGVVRFTVTISPEGTVQHLELVSGHPLLVPAAQDSIREWKWQPTMLNERPVEVISVVDVNFTLDPAQQ